mgnify:CR=1 FL=1
MTKRFSSKIKTIIVVVLVFMILTAIIGIIVNRKDNVVVSSFSLSVNGDVISSDKSGYIVTIDNPLSVEVLFPSNVAAEDMVYSYGIQTSKDNDFRFYVDYKSYSFSQWKIDVDKCFDIVPTKSGFIIMPKSNSIQGLLNLCYPGSDIHFDENDIDDDRDLFLLTVKSKSDSSIAVGFRLMSNIKSIELDKTEIVF